jgi:hypothetical protein
MDEQSATLASLEFQRNKFDGKAKSPMSALRCIPRNLRRPLILNGA